MSITTEEANKVMKRCQVGTRSYDEANDLHAECYGTIGALVAERDALRARIDEGVRVNAEINPYDGEIESYSNFLLETNATLVLDEGIKL